MANTEALRHTISRLRDTNGVLRERNARLKQTNAVLRERNARLAEAVQAARARRTKLAATLAASRERLADLRERLALATAERKLDRGSGKPPPLEHNTSAGMDRFYVNAANLQHLEDEFYGRFAQALRHVMDDADVMPEGRTVADFGCGTGHVLRLLLAGAVPASVTGFDYSETALGVARTLLPEARFLCHDIYTPVEEEFDVVLCIETVEHLLYPRRGFSAVLRTIAPGGVALVSVPDGRSDVSLSHINFWSPEGWPVFVDEIVASIDAGGSRLHPSCGVLEMERAPITYNYALIRRAG